MIDRRDAASAAKLIKSYCDQERWLTCSNCIFNNGTYKCTLGRDNPSYWPLTNGDYTIDERIQAARLLYNDHYDTVCVNYNADGRHVTAYSKSDHNYGKILQPDAFPSITNYGQYSLEKNRGG